jgi:hypothetical protein
VLVSRPDLRFVASAIVVAACASKAPGQMLVDAGHVDSTSADASGDADLGPGTPRDWTTYPAIVQLDGASTLWVVSDIHGDYNAATKLFAGAGVISAIPDVPADVTWARGSDVLVVVGDLIDKGPDAPDVVRLVIALQASAAAAGGTVIVTMGNHEAEFLANPSDPDAIKTGSDEGFDPELEADGLTPLATAEGDNSLGAFLRNLPIAARVDDWFFVHAGNTGSASIAAMTTAVMTGVDDGGYGTPILAGSNSMLEARLSSSGPQWWDATKDATTLLTQYTAAVGCTHLVMGHQPGAVGLVSEKNRAQDQMDAAYGGLLFLIDTGMSVGVDDTGGALLHVTDAGGSGEAWDEVFPSGSASSL